MHKLKQSIYLLEEIFINLNFFVEEMRKKLLLINHQFFFAKKNEQLLTITLGGIILNNQFDSLIQTFFLQKARMKRDKQKNQPSTTTALQKKEFLKISMPPKSHCVLVPGKFLNLP